MTDELNEDDLAAARILTGAPAQRLGFGGHVYNDSNLTRGLPALQARPRLTASTPAAANVYALTRRPSTSGSVKSTAKRTKTIAKSTGKASSKSSAARTVLKPVSPPSPPPRANPRPARFRFRPLEYWNGERVVYGHDATAPFASICDVVVVERDE